MKESVACVPHGSRAVRCFRPMNGSTFEKQTIVITGNRVADVGGVKVTNTTKARSVLTQEFIARQQPGQSIDDIINYLPGVSFPRAILSYGDAGGTLTIHGFDASRISPDVRRRPDERRLGNYALFSQEQLDPELISEVNVSVGSTDLDSPTASATGGTVNYVLRDPDRPDARAVTGLPGLFRVPSVPSLCFDTGEFTPFWNQGVLRGEQSKGPQPVRIEQQGTTSPQLNGKIYQPLGGDDFVSVNAFYVRNRGQEIQRRHSGHVPDLIVAHVAEAACLHDDRAGRPARKTSTMAAASQQTAISDTAFIPADIFRLHLNSRFTSRAGFHPDARAQLRTHRSQRRRRGCRDRGHPPTVKVNGVNHADLWLSSAASPFFGGVDLNGDGDTLDTVRSMPPRIPDQPLRHHRQPHLQMSDTQQFRVNYTLDHARLRQTGESGLSGRMAVRSPLPRP